MRRQYSFKKCVIAVILALPSFISAEFLHHDLGYANHFGAMHENTFFSMYENPALLRSVPAAYGSFSRKYGFSELDETTIGVEFPFESFRTALFASTFQTLPYREQQVGLSVNKTFRSLITVGITLKMLHLDCMEISKTAFSYDLGIAARYKNHHIAVSVKDPDRPYITAAIPMTSLVKYSMNLGKFTANCTYTSITSLYSNWLVASEYTITDFLTFSYGVRITNGEHRAGIRMNRHNIHINIAYIVPETLPGYLLAETGVTW